MKNLWTIRLKKSKKMGVKTYWFTVSLKSCHISGKFIEKIGFLIFLPNSKSRFLFLNFERFGFWLLKGANFSQRVSSLLGQLHFITKKSFKLNFFLKKKLTYLNKSKN